MKKYESIFWIVGLCAYVAFMCSGIIWLLGVCEIQWSLFPTLKQAANLILTIAAFGSGWIWLCSMLKNKNVRLVLQIIFIIFGVLAVLGVFSIGI